MTADHAGQTGELVTELNLRFLDASFATYRRDDIAAHQHLSVQIDVDRYRDLGRPSTITVTVRGNR